MTANIDTMMYTGDVPWHHLGTALDHPATASEAIMAAGLGWVVEKMEVYAAGKAVRGARALVRTDRMEPLSIVGKRYKPIQNAEAFAFVDRLVGEGKAVYQTAGSLDGGRRIWLLAKLPGDLRVTDEDAVNKYLLLTNPHSRRMARVMFTPIRVVCENTLNAALKDAEGGLALRHSGDIDGQIAEARRVLGISLRYFDDFGGQASQFARRAMTQAALKEFVAELVPLPKNAGADPTRALARRDRIVELFEGGRGSALVGARGTLWGAVNAVAEYVDHERPVRAKVEGVRSVDEKRFTSAMFGTGAELKQRAWDAALAIA